MAILGMCLTAKNAKNRVITNARKAHTNAISTPNASIYSRDMNANVTRVSQNTKKNQKPPINY